MIACTREPGGTFTINGLNAAQLREIEDGLIEQFNRTSKDIHRDYRYQLLEILKPISAALDLHERQLMNTSQTSLPL